MCKYAIVVCLCFLVTSIGKAQCLINQEEVIAFCTEENDLGITYTVKTDPECTFAYPIGCIENNWSRAGSWFIMQIAQPGDLGITMQHSKHTDVDFIAFGPFAGESKKEVLDSVCRNQNSIFYNPFVGIFTNHLIETNERNGINLSMTDVESPYFRGNFDEYPIPNIVDCSSSRYSSELCYLPKAQSGEWYLLFISNWSMQPGEINFRKTYGTATTNCSVIVDAYSTGPYCEGDDILLKVNNSPTNATFLWTGPNGFSSTDKDPVIPKATVEDSGEYSVVMYYNGNESDEIPVPVQVLRSDLITIEKEVFLDYKETFYFNDKPYYKSGKYDFVYQNEVGCDSIITLDLTLHPKIDTHIIPTVFSPINGDGVNDVFMEGYKTYIYDRYGNLVCHSDNGWNGLYRGSYADAGIYVYKVEMKDGVVRKGTIEVLK